MSNSNPGDSRPPLSLPVSIVLVLLAVLGNGLLLFYPRPSTAPVVADAGKPVAAAPTAPGPAQTAQPTPTNPAPPPTSPFAPPASPFAQAPSAPTPAPAAPTPPKPEEPAKEVIEGGLTLVVQSQAGGDADRRTARVPSLYVPAGSQPTPFVAGGPFTATFEGFINKEVWDRVTFTAEGTGSLTFTVNGTEVLKIDGPDLASGKAGKIKLNKGANPISLVYKSPATGDARLRLMWAGSEIPTEPLPATLFTHDVGSKEFRAASKTRLGRELVGNMRCTKCHAADASAAEGMPELAMDAPDLREIGGRLHKDWMAAWIRDPKALRAHASMPKLIVTDGKTEAEVDAEAAHMAAYLAELGNRDDGALSTDEAAIGRGGHLFVKLACASCHVANGNSPAQIPLTHVKSKWKPKALVAFLQEPNKHYAWIKMPKFGFSEAEATDLAAWLLKNGAEEPKKISGGDPFRGKLLMAGAGCASCHQVGDIPPVIATKLKDVAQNRANGCLATDAQSRGRAPDYGFSGEEIAALRAFVKTDQKSLAVRDTVEFAERRIDAQRCTSCHQRDNRNSVISGMGAALDKIVATLPPAPAPEAHGEHGEGGAASGNPAPMLTFAGDKLRPEWTAKLLKGALPYRSRPWLDMRMPAFAAGADLVAQGMAMSHGLPPVTPTDPPSAGPGAEDGLKLLGADGGFNCIQCHGVGAAPAVAVFEAPGINLGYADQRLQKDYYHRWMLNPLRFDPTTRMPKFAQDDGTTPLTDVLGGQARDQFEALWQQLIEAGKATDFPH